MPLSAFLFSHRSYNFHSSDVILMFIYNFQSDFGREVPLFEVEATAVEPVFQKLYSYIFDMDSVGSSVTEMDKPVPSAIFIVNFDKV